MPNPFAEQKQPEQQQDDQQKQQKKVGIVKKSSEIAVLRIPIVVFTNQHLNQDHPSIVTVKNYLSEGFKPFGVLNSDTGHAVLFLFRDND